jgi:hypothetical protein
LRMTLRLVRCWSRKAISMWKGPSPNTNSWNTTIPWGMPSYFLSSRGRAR